MVIDKRIGLFYNCSEIILFIQHTYIYIEVFAYVNSDFLHTSTSLRQLLTSPYEARQHQSPTDARVLHK